MSNTFNKLNILKRLKLAFMHNNEELKSCVLDYVTDKLNNGNFRQIIKTNEWELFCSTDQALAQEIMDAVFDKTNCLS